MSETLLARAPGTVRFDAQTAARLHDVIVDGQVVTMPRVAADGLEIWCVLVEQEDR